jgi:adenylate cyclase
MAQEIERKFLVESGHIPVLGHGLEIIQGYCSTTRSVAVRIRVAGEQAWITLKGESRGAVRSEFEYRIPVADARQMLDEFCAGRVIQKTRYTLEHDEHVWEVDVFSGDNAGLVVAEVELTDEQEELRLPSWVGAEVTLDSRYFNSNLYQHPYLEWEQP